MNLSFFYFEKHLKMLFFVTESELLKMTKNGKKGAALCYKTAIFSSRKGQNALDLGGGL